MEFGSFRYEENILVFVSLDFPNFLWSKNTVSQENKIYDAIDTFIQKPNSSTLKKLETEEKIFAKTSKLKEDFWHW